MIATNVPTEHFGQVPICRVTGEVAYSTRLPAQPSLGIYDLEVEHA